MLDAACGLRTGCQGAQRPLQTGIAGERCVSESLVIRLGTNKQQPVAWLVWSGQEQEIIASGTLASAHALGELQERAGGRPVVTLVPGSDLIFRRVSLPGKYSRQAAAALPYLLEEQIASEELRSATPIAPAYEGTTDDPIARAAMGGIPDGPATASFFLSSCHSSVGSLALAALS
jgi:hypothetical protein